VRQARPKGVLLITAGEEPGLAQALSDLPVETLKLNEEPLKATLALARRYWASSTEVALANVDEAGPAIYAATWAAHAAMPVIVFSNVERRSVSAGLSELGVKQVTVVSESGKRIPGLGLPDEMLVDSLSPRGVRQRLVALLDAAKIRNVVVARTPDAEDNAGGASWLGPYMSLTRRSLLVLCRVHTAANVEKFVFDVLQTYQLKPDTLTLLADTASIGMHMVRIDEETEAEKYYRVPVEPCSPTHSTQTAALGIGRLPCSSTSDASLWFVRGLLRQRQSAPPLKALLVANPGLSDWELPLCEAIARVTAQEFKNCGLQVSEFYGVAADRPDIVEAAQDADIIMYQGHTEHQDLFKGRRRNGRAAEVPGVASAQAAVKRVDAFPVVILQTCDSNQPGTVQRIHEAGGVAIVGTATPIHSGPGSTLAKALCDSLLYRRATLGEALRDAKNCLFCMQDLKRLRNHQEAAKTERTALSFQLLGDPELQLFSPSAGGPARPPVTAKWLSADRLQVELPPRPLPEVRSDGYSARFYPGSEASGLTVRQRESNARRIVPSYYFRFRLPDKWQSRQATEAAREDGEASRTVFRVDPTGRFLYVLYLSDREAANGTFVLRWGRPADGPAVPASPSLGVDR
jgi:hypothetical protein